MNRRRLLRTTCAALLVFAGNCVAAPVGAGDPYTRWHVQTSPGLDAVVFIGALVGSGLQKEQYETEARRMRSKMDDASLEALHHLAEFADISGTLIGPNLALLFSAGPIETLDDVIRSARDPDRWLRPNLEQSKYWDAREWGWFRDETVPDVLAVLLALKSGGYENYWRRVAEPKLELRVDATRRYLEHYDIIPEQERLLGRRLDPEIDVLLLYFSKPYGIRVTGQRFASHFSYPMHVQLRTATHEMFHPPFDRADLSIYEKLKPLIDDPWLQSILKDHDPAIGYNTFPELLDEGSSQALDQIVADRMGFEWGPGARWRTADGGMHMLAAAIYQMLKEDGFDRTGGSYSEWLPAAIDRGLFRPDEVKRRAALIVGQDAVDRWPKHLRDHP